jgi:hypothetical protein
VVLRPEENVLVPCIREALQNAAKHAPAATVCVGLTREGESLLFEVRDALMASRVAWTRFTDPDSKGCTIGSPRWVVSCGSPLRLARVRRLRVGCP